jgi:hypothetical protein
MSLEDQYRRHAADSLDLASRQSSSADKSRLLLMAEAWLDLADRIAKRLKKRAATVEHPLVEQVLGPDQPNAE